MEEKNYSELEKELEKLKSELEIQDELTNRFTSPVSTNYWQKRLEEERTLFEKRLLAREEEKKILESRIKQQEIQLQNYESKLSQLEKNFDRELQSWQEKFRIKEADLLLEKNRILWEEKVKDAESEIKQLLEKITNLNAEIARLKDESIKEREELVKNFESERELLNEKISLYQKTSEELSARLTEAKSASEEQINALKAEIDRHNRKIADLTAQIEKLSAEKEKMLSEIKKLTEEFTTKENTLVKTHSESIKNISRDIEHHLFLLGKITQYRKSQKMLAGQEIHFIIKRITDGLNSLSQQKTTVPTGEEIKKVICLGDVKSEILDRIRGSEVLLFKENQIKWLKKIKPRAVVVKNIKLAQKISLKYPFLPVVLVGPLRGVLKKVQANVKVIADVSDSFKVAQEIENVIDDSIAIEEFWHTLVPKNRTTKYLAAMLLITSLIYGITNPPPIFLPSEKIIEYAVPYSYPSAIATDTSYLWVCDWQMGSIYHHKMDKSLSIQRIVYFPESAFSAIAFSGDSIYTVNPWSKKINKHLLNDTLSIARTYSIGELNLSGLTIANGLVYASDISKRAIYLGKLVDETKTFEILKTYPSPDNSPVGVWFDGKKLWSCDSSTNQIYLHRMDETLSVESTFMLPEGFQKNFKLSGFTGTTDRFWLSSEKLGKIFSVPRSSLIDLKASKS